MLTTETLRTSMDIPTFRNLKLCMLRNQPTEVAIEANHRIDITLELLEAETMSAEALALIISDVVADYEEHSHV